MEKKTKDNHRWIKYYVQKIGIITGRAHVETMAGRESGKNIDRQMEVSACSLTFINVH